MSSQEFDECRTILYVAAELLDTLVGSFDLVTVAPFTALTSAWLLTKKRVLQFFNIFSVVFPNNLHHCRNFVPHLSFPIQQQYEHHTLLLID